MNAAANADLSEAQMNILENNMSQIMEGANPGVATQRTPMRSEMYPNFEAAGRATVEPRMPDSIGDFANDQSALRGWESEGGATPLDSEPGAFDFRSPGPSFDNANAFSGAAATEGLSGGLSEGLSLLGTVGAIYGIAHDLNQIVEAPPDQQAALTAEKAGAWAGAIEFGEIGAETGAVIGGPIGALVGGVVGGAYGYYAGGAVAKGFTDMVHDFCAPNRSSSLKG